jgi:hypothetical protein
LRGRTAIGTLSPMDARDEQMLFEALFEARDDVRKVLRLLGGDEENEEEDS